MDTPKTLPTGTANNSKYSGSPRQRNLARLLRVAILLSQRPYSINEISKKTATDEKTVRRDLRALEMAGIPVASDEDDGHVYNLRYSVDPHFMRRFL